MDPGHIECSPHALESQERYSGFLFPIFLLPSVFHFTVLLARLTAFCHNPLQYHYLKLECDSLRDGETVTLATQKSQQYGDLQNSDLVAKKKIYVNTTTARSTSVDPHGSLSPANPVIHRCWQAVSRDPGVCLQQINKCASLSSNAPFAMLQFSQNQIANNFIFTLLAMTAEP